MSEVSDGGLGVVIVAGGEGRRLSTVTGVLPKALAPLGDTTLLGHQLEQCAPLNAVCTVVLTCLGRGDDAIAAHVLGRALVVREPRPLGTAGGLHLLPPGPSRWLVVNVDHVSDVDRVALVREAQAPVTAVLWRAPVPVDEGVVELSAAEDGGLRLTAWQERPILKLPVTTGMYVFEDAALRSVVGNGKGGPLDMPDLVCALIPAGVHAHMHDGYWIDAGTPDRLSKAVRWLQGGVPSPAEG